MYIRDEVQFEQETYNSKYEIYTLDYTARHRKTEQLLDGRSICIAMASRDVEPNLRNKLNQMNYELVYISTMGKISTERSVWFSDELLETLVLENEKDVKANIERRRQINKPYKMRVSKDDKKQLQPKEHKKEGLLHKIMNINV